MISTQGSRFVVSLSSIAPHAGKWFGGGRHVILRPLSKSSRPGREPPLPPLTNPIENAIEAARQRGEFQNLSGSGKPLPKGESVLAVAGGGGSPSELLAQKAEFEMRRAIRNNELENIGGEGEKLKYKGTGISPSIGGESGGGGGGNAMEHYILDQSRISADDMKKK